MEKDFKTLSAERLNEAMNDLNINATKLSKAAGISRSSISQYLHGVSSPSKTAAIKLSLILKVNPAWLQGMNGYKYADPVVSEEAADTIMNELWDLELLYTRLPNKGREELKSLMGYLVYKYEGKE